MCWCLKALYNSGARKAALFGVGVIGCTPSALSRTRGSACVAAMNNAAQRFNGKLKSLVDQLNGKLRDARFIYVNIFGMGSGDPRAAGTELTSKTSFVFSYYFNEGFRNLLRKFTQGD